MIMAKSSLNLSAIVAIIALFCSVSNGASPSKPNVIFILADDLGWDDVSFHGSIEIPTPNLDALAHSGIILNNYYVNPICTPSRSALMTGKSPMHTGMYHNVIMAGEPWGLPLSEKIMPQYLKELGYATHAVGKWHLGFFKKEYTPTRRGFDSHFGYWNGAGDYYDHTSSEGLKWGLDFRRNLSLARDSLGKYSTDLFTEEAVRIIESHDVTQPLFLYFAHQAVHSANVYDPIQAPESAVKKFPNIEDINRRKFAGAVSKLDESVGNVIFALSKKKMLENSIVIFSTDNGGPPPGFNMNAASNWPLRGTKDSLWEGGVRGAALIWSPLLYVPSRVSNHLMGIEDWLPTIYRAAGGDVKRLGNIDGLNLWDALNLNTSSPKKEVLHMIDNMRSIGALRVGDYKIISGSCYGSNWNGWYGPPKLSRHENANPQPPWLNSRIGKIVNKIRINKGLRLLVASDVARLLKAVKVDCGTKPSNASTNCTPTLRPCLYNIRKDPCEYYNIAEQHTDIFQAMMNRLQEYNATVVPPLNKPVDPASFPKYHGYAWVPWMDN